MKKNVSATRVGKFASGMILAAVLIGIVPALADCQVIDNSFRLTGDQLDKLLEPIALYPDPLLAEVLPACSYWDEVQQANAWLSNNSNPSDSAIDEQEW